MNRSVEIDFYYIVKYPTLFLKIGLYSIHPDTTATQPIAISFLMSIYLPCTDHTMDCSSIQIKIRFVREKDRGEEWIDM